MARVEVLTGPERRRRWSEEQKRAIVAASLAPGAVISEVARRGFNRTIVALANKTARIAWVLLTRQEAYAAP